MKFVYPPKRIDVADDKMERTTSVFISNLHCGSCVQTIEAALHDVPNHSKLISVNVSIVAQTVTVVHMSDVTRDDIELALDQAGFDLPHRKQISEEDSGRRKRHVEQCVACQDLEKATQPTPSIPIPPEPTTTTLPPSNASLTLRVTYSITGMTCAACSGTITRGLSAEPDLSDISVNLLGNSMTLLTSSEARAKEVVELVEEMGYECSIFDIKPLVPLPPPSSEKVRATYSIGGMTCAACSGAISRSLADMSGIEDVNVNLLGNSMTLIAESEEKAKEVAEHVDDMGYECEIFKIKLAQSRREGEGEGVERVVDIRIEGMFCEKCPENVMASLQPLLSQIKVLKPLTSTQSPILKLVYTPSPTLTIREILHALSSTSSKFKATLHHPPTLESLAHAAQAHERRSLLYRLLFTFLIAIPTFILGVVFMSLLPSSHPLRIWIQAPLFDGEKGVSRGIWALFILATPVQFISAFPFHRRAIKEIRALWRRGSKIPIWRRFLRFGSMNLLISLGVSVAYFSSVALLALGMKDGGGNMTTYFDSVVFLSLFLLFGRYLEAYSKSHTADAVASLGKLRPTTALLVDSSPVSFDADTDEKQSERELSLESDHSLDLEKGLPSSSHPSSSDLHKEKQSPSRSHINRILLDLLEINDIVRVIPGSTPPADGIIVSDTPSSFDESSLTGESRPVPKSLGDRVFVGTICKNTPVDIRIDKLTGETMLDHVVDIVREGQANRAPIERVADMLTGYFVPVVVAISVTTWVVWVVLGESGALPQSYLDIGIGGWPVWSLRFAIAVFVVACPCGIGLAAPTALLVGSGLAAKFGILVRGGGEAFQDAAQLDIIVFDKTGTLTQGVDPTVTDVILRADDRKENEILSIVHSLESASSHPLAVALSRYCEARGASQITMKDVEEIPGKGVRGVFGDMNTAVLVGNEAFLRESGIPLSDSDLNTLEKWKSQGKSVVLVASSGSLLAMFAVADPLRAEAKDVIGKLQEAGYGTWMISGDNAVTAKAVAGTVGIPEGNVIAEVLPHEKADRVQWLQRVGMKRNGKNSEGENSRAVVAMCGDGINDAPALAAADVGIAIGSGSDVAISSASFILLSSDLRSILTLTDLSRVVFRRVKFNFAWATVYNLIAIPVAAGVIYPAGHARLDPVWASLAMALSSVSVVTSSLMLKLYRPPKMSDPISH